MEALNISYTKHFGSLASGAHTPWGITGCPVVIAVAREHFWGLASGAHKPKGIMGWLIVMAVALEHFGCFLPVSTSPGASWAVHRRRRCSGTICAPTPCDPRYRLEPSMREPNIACVGQCSTYARALAHFNSLRANLGHSIVQSSTIY
jgi:hypothetical protein